MPSIDALVPVKGFALAKERLRGSLAADERAALARAMFQDVLSALLATRRLRGVWVVTADDEVEALANAAGARTTREPAGTTGLNGALSAGRDALLRTAPPQALLVTPADIPSATPDAVTEFLTPDADRPAVRVCPAPDGGTNALLMAPAAAIPFRFGPASAAHHLAEAAMAGLCAEERAAPLLRLDIDQPADLKQLGIARCGPRTAALLRTLQLTLGNSST